VLVLASQFRGVAGVVEEIDLEAVEILEGHRDAGLLGVVAGLAQAFGGPLELLLGGALTAEDAERRVERADELLHAHRLAAVDDRLQVLHAGRALLLVFADQVVVGVEARDRAPLEADAVELLRERRELFRSGVEDRELYEVEARLLEPLEERGELRRRAVAGPQ